MEWLKELETVLPTQTLIDRTAKQKQDQVKAIVSKPYTVIRNQGQKTKHSVDQTMNYTRKSRKSLSKLFKNPLPKT